MNLPAIFSLIFAALISLLPVLLLMGRRAVQSRSIREDKGGAPDAKTPPGANSQGPEAQPIMGRLSDRPENDQANQRPRLQESRPQPPRPVREIYPQRRRETLEQELKDAARIAGVRRERLGGVSFGVSVSPERRPPGQVLEARVAPLSPLQRAVVYSELLGPPAGLRRPGRRDEP